VRLDLPYFVWLASQMKRAAEIDLTEVSCMAGRPVNPRSAKQLAKLLYDEMDEPVKRWTKTGTPSTDKYALRMMEAPLAAAALQYRETVTALSNFVLKLPKLVLDDGRVHGSFHQAGTWEESGDDYRSSPASGRLSSSGPNLQQISAHGRWGIAIRRGFVPQAGCVFVGGDVEQEELRIAALLANETKLLKAFRSGLSPHELTAKALGIGRDNGKTCNYALIYGVAAQKLLTLVPSLGSVAAAEEARQDFFVLYPALKSWHEQVAAECSRLGYVETWFGRRRYLPEIWSRSRKRRREAERQAVNHTVQGTGADILKMALRRVYDGLEVGSRIVLSSHDDVIVETSHPTEVRAVLEGMTKGLLPVELPVNVKQGPNWGDML